MLEQRLEADIKTAMLAHDATTVTTLRGLKAGILSLKVTNNSRGSVLPDDQVIALFSKEVKKRQESADLYQQGGNRPMADAELAEKTLIETYLPTQLSEAELSVVVNTVVDQLESVDMSKMGATIAAVKLQTAGAADDGAVIARLVKERLSR